MKLEFDVLYGRSSAETKRQLDEVVRDDAELLGEFDDVPRLYSVSKRESINAYQRRQAALRRALRLSRVAAKNGGGS